jgi:ubiquinol-cytochrome c reductase cytochrome b subunit
LFIGAQHPEPPFILVGQISTFFYFAWFLIIVPVLGIMENTLMDIAIPSSLEAK